MAKLAQTANREFANVHYKHITTDPLRKKDYECRYCHQLLKSVGPKRLQDHIRGGNPDVKACPGPPETDDEYLEREQAFLLVRQCLVEDTAKQKMAKAAQDLRNQKLDDLLKGSHMLTQRGKKDHRSKQN